MDANLQSYALVLHQDADPRTGGTAVCGFTTAGMVGVISTSHIIKTLGLRQLGTVMHKDFPAVALIHDEVPKHPVRVYQGEGIGVFTSEIQFGNETDIPFATTVLEWFTKGGFDRL
ncbi:MAG: PAC2 family protein, partial [Candidatus Poseidoniaceae archaeon]